MSKKVKMCYIPTCPSTNINSNKTFIEVPRVNPRRVQWLSAANLDPNRIGRLYCCEDHFDVHLDFTNFKEHKRYGTKLVYKNMSICPSLYLDSSPPEFHEKSLKKLRKRKKIDSENNQSSPKHFHFVDVDKSTDVEPVLIFDPEKYNAQSQEQEVLIKDEPDEIDTKDEMWPMLMLESQLESEENMVIEDQPSFISLSEVYLDNTEPKLRKKRSTEIQVLEQDAEELDGAKLQPQHRCKCGSSYSRPPEAPTSICDMIDFDDPYKKAAMHFDKSQRQMSTVQIIQMSPKFYLGLPINMMYILKSVSIQEKIFPLDLLITLNKIRLNDPFMRLSIDFGISETRSRDIFRETVPKLARSLANFICWTGHGDTSAFYVNIFKLNADPNDPLVWSSSRERIFERDEDPKGYTMKCLVCHSRAGAVSYVSALFPAKMADIEVIAFSEVLNSVPPWAELFLFNHLDMQHQKTPEGLFYLKKYMEKNKITATKEVFLDVLYKSIGSRMVVLEIMEEKKIKVNIIERLSKFGILKNHSKASREIVLIMHDIIKIVCALINTEHLSVAL